VRDQAPDLILRKLRVPGRHAMGAAFGDRVENLSVLIAVQPVHVAQARSHAAAGVVAMTAGTVERREQPAPLAGRAAIAGTGICYARDAIERAWYRTNWHRDRRRCVALPQVTGRRAAGDGGTAQEHRTNEQSGAALQR